MRPPSRYRISTDVRRSKNYLIYPTDLKRSSWGYRDKKKILSVLETYGEDLEKLIEAFPNKSPLEIFTFLGNYKDYCSALNRHYYSNEQPEDAQGWISACDKTIPSQISQPFKNNTNVLGKIMNDIVGKFEINTPQLKEISNIMDLKKIMIFVANIVNLKPVGNLKPYEALLLLSIVESLENKITTYKYLGPQMVSHALNVIKLGPLHAKLYFNEASNVLEKAQKISMVKSKNKGVSNAIDILKIAEDDIAQAIKSFYERENGSDTQLDLCSQNVDANTTEVIQNSALNNIFEPYLPSLSQEVHTSFKINPKITKVENMLKDQLFSLNPFCLPTLKVPFGLDNFVENIMPSSKPSAFNNYDINENMTPSTDKNCNTSAAFRVYGKSKQTHAS